MNKTYRVTFTDINNTTNFINSLEMLEAVEYVERVPAMYQCIIPNDPLLYNQYYWDLINANAAHNIHAGGNAIVSIVDDAVLTSHEDIAANINAVNRDVANLDNNPNPPLTGLSAANGTVFSHGTHVAGIACGVTNNSKGIASIGWSNKIMAVKTRPDNDASNAIPYGYDGVAWAATNGAHVINMSWSGQAYSQTEYNVIASAKAAGCILVAAAGNDYNSVPHYPAAYGEGMSSQSWEVYDKNLVIAVASIDANNTISTWGAGVFGQPLGSCFGQWVDIAAYGSGILSTKANSTNGVPVTNQYQVLDGTSMAAPMVSGVIGLMRSYKPTASAQEIINCLLGSANPDIYNHNSSNLDGLLGRGRVDAEAALSCLGVNCSFNPVAVIVPSANTICPNSTISLTTNQGTGYIWSDGATTQTTSINQAGDYSVTVTFSGGCTASASITISPADPIAHIYMVENSGSTPNDGLLCGQDFLNVYASYGLSYHWNNAFGATTQTIPGSIYAGSDIPFIWNFSVEVDGVSGCAGVNSTVSATAQWGEVPSPNISPTSVTICIGSTASLEVSGGENYLWSNGANTSTIAVTPEATTTYTVTVSNEQTCTGSASRTVNVSSVSSAHIVQNTNCGNGISFLVSSSGTSINYAWSVPVGATNPGNTNLITDVSVAGTYTVTVSAADCTSIVSSTVSENDLHPIVIGFGNNVSSYIANGMLLPMNGGTTSAAQRIYVEGTLYIDINYTFASGSEIIAREGAVLVVGWNRLLRLKGTHIHGCGTLWKGIRLLEGTNTGHWGASVSTTDNTLIEDAYFGILMKPGTVLSEISNTTFHNNYIGIAGVGHSNGVVQDMAPFSQNSNFYGNIFSSDALLMPYVGIANDNIEQDLPIPIAGQHGLAGIYMSGLGTLTVGTTSIGSVPNTFQNLSNGIIALNNHLIVQNSQFDNMQYFETTYLNKGNGIYAKGNNSITMGVPAFSLTVGTSHMTNIKIAGVNAERVNATIENNLISADVGGISVSNSAGGIINVSQNNIVSGLVGINVSQNDPYNQQLVSGNQISISNGLYGGGAIMDVETNSSPLGNANNGIINNAIILNPYLMNTVGIIINTVNNSYVHSNSVSVQGNANKVDAGIKINSCEATLVQENTVSSIDQDYTSAILINGTNGSYNIICSNNTDGTNTGLAFTGANGTIDFSSNTLGNHSNGLWVQSGAIASQRIDIS